MILCKRQCAQQYSLQCALLHPFAHQWHFLATSPNLSKLSAHHHQNIRYPCHINHLSLHYRQTKQVVLLEAFDISMVVPLLPVTGGDASSWFR